MRAETKEFLDFALSRYREIFPFNESDNKDRFYTFSGIIHDICEKWDLRNEHKRLEQEDIVSYAIIAEKTAKTVYSAVLVSRNFWDKTDIEIVCENGAIKVAYSKNGSPIMHQSGKLIGYITQLTKIEK